MTLEINTSQCSSLRDYLERYQIWCDNRYFYQGIQKNVVRSGNTGIPCYNIRTQLHQIQQDTSKVIFVDNLTEGINVRHLLNQCPRDKFYVIFSNGSWNSNEYPMTIQYAQIHHHYYLFDFAATFQSPFKFSFYVDKSYDFEYPKPQYFISTTGNTRSERDRIVKLLLEKINYKNFIFRYNGVDIGLPCNHDIPQITDKNFGSGIYKDIDGLEKYFHSIIHTLPINIYNQAYFNLLLEGEIDWPNQFNPTEKIVKTLISGMPFVLAGSPGFLEHLRKLGFETYHSCWDETYDNIVDYGQRMQAVMDLCNQLEHFDWHGNKDHLQTIAYKNRNNFFNLNQVANKEFLSFETAVENLLNGIYTP